jgi:nucleotide-binding universal stress UspA family protein
MLIGLDGTDESDAALGLGLEWAGRFDAQVAGIAVVDEPGVLLSEAVLFGGPGSGRAPAPLLTEATHQVENLLAHFSVRCAEAGARHRVVEGAGAPYVRILEEAQRHDLILWGQRTHFGYHWEHPGDETLSRVVRDGPRPVVAVPTGAVGGEGVVIAYDGSLQAARAVYAFEASGMGRSETVHVVSVGGAGRRGGAGRLAQRAVEFLRSHAIRAAARPVETFSPPAEAILEEVERLGAGLLVMGAYGQPVLREFLVGSVTRSVLRESRVPVFLFH